MEQWIFDSPGQAGECIRQFLKDCYQGNKLVKGELVVGDKTVNLRNITMPLLNIYASGDHLVPPAASRPLNDLVGTSDKTLYEFKGGHIGVFVGSKSQKELAPKIAEWLHDRQDRGEGKTPAAPVEAGGTSLAAEAQGKPSRPAQGHPGEKKGNQKDKKK
jgi:polyhydroxyalkanoate synthase